MSCRSTRARAAKIVLEEPLEQTRKITDVFKVTRGRGRTQKKLHGDETRVDTKPLLASGFIQQELTEGVCSSAKAETICSPPKRAKKCTDHTQRSARKILFATDDNKKSSPKKEMVVEVSQTDVLVSSTATVEMTTRTNVSATVKSETSRETESCVVVSPAKDSLISRAEELSERLTSKAAQIKARARIRSVAELQAVLAQKGAVKAVHEQAQRIKSQKVEEHAKILKSPVKSVPKGSARGELTTKAKFSSPQKRLEPSTSVVPDFILPTHKTPAKASLDEFELNETRYSVCCTRNVHKCCHRIIHHQGRRCAVLEIQKNVEKNTQLSFTRKHLAQIIHVYPTSYDVRLDKRRKAFGGDAESYGKKELIMTANLVDDLTGFMLPDTPVKCDDQPLPSVTPSKLMSPRKKVVTALPRDPVLDARPRLEGWRMTCRSHVFRHKLVEIAKKFHRKFLERIGFTLKDAELARLRRFHPKFDIEQECEELEQAKLPEDEHDGSEQHFEMKDYFAMVDTSVPLPKAVSAALEDLKSPVKKLMSSNSAVPLSPRQFAEKQASKPKGSMSLLERIRAKEAERKAAEKLRDPVLCIKKVRSMDLRTLSEQVARSQSSMNRDLLMEHLTILCEVAPSYLAFTELGGKKYLQLKENNYNAIEKVVEEEVARLRSSLPSVTQLQQGVPVENAVKKAAVRALF
ncbi:DNA replication factor CDT1 like protein [Cooperia oncophora]